MSTAEIAKSQQFCMVLFALGPIQNFIASARHPRDLWFGSLLLSELSRFVAIKLKEQDPNNIKIIFPGTSKLENSNVSVANKILMIWENVDLPTVRKRLAEVQRQVRDQLKKMIELVIKELKKHISALEIESIEKIEFEPKLAIEQVCNLIETMWVAHCYTVSNVQDQEETQKKYAEARDAVERALAARKNTRDWQQNTLISRRKSSLDAQQTSVFRTPKLLNDARDRAKLKKLGIREHEMLSGIDILKRCDEIVDDKAALYETFFPNTDLTQTRKYFANAGVFWDGYSKTEYDAEGNEQPNQDAQRKREKRQHNYYALLLADGDYMGKVIDAQQSFQAHKELSNDLDAFAQSVPDIIREKYNGHCIYAGGDDVLALLPIKNVLACAEELRDQYQTKLSKYKYVDNGEKKNSTLSVGIAIAHHNTPFHLIRKQAQDAEKAAKGHFGRDAVAISLQKQTEPTIVGDKGDAFIDNLGDWVERIEKDEFSSGVLYAIGEVAEQYQDFDDTAKDALIAYALKQKKTDPEVQEKILKALQQQYKDDAPTDKDKKTYQTKYQKFANLLYVARMIVNLSKPE